MRHTYAAVLAGVPAAMDAQGNGQLDTLLSHIGTDLPVCRYRQWTGEFASASALAAVMAVSCIESGCVPGALVGGGDILLQPDTRVLVLGTGTCLTAMEFFRP
jgi:3-oxoacyl-[acyl-carrier-protein] synthase-1/3-oxoacyl-[acyl-carrier-protein] synthase II